MELSNIFGMTIFGAGLGFGAAIQPGPLQAFLLTRAAQTGWRHTWPACFAPFLSDGPIALAALLLLGRFPPVAQNALRIAGGLLLLYFAAGAFREWRRPAAEVLRLNAPRTVLAAAAVNFLNPNPYLAWMLVLGPTVVSAWRRHPAEAVAFLTGSYGALIATTVSIVLIVGRAGAISPRARHALTLVSMLLLVGLGLTLAGAGLRGLVTY